MKSEITELPQEEVKYPCIMLDGGSETVVFFSSPKNGIVVNGSVSYPLGYFYNDWAMDCFRPFNKAVTLSN